ncbi:MAG TPA: PaaI family thioesterase [Oculatellaceae cyanobacterium]|jgi:uncharacterized protein (TIGR00369 family)
MPLEKELYDRILERARQIPIFDRIGIKIEDLSPGECIACVPHDKSFDGIFGSFHGGMLGTVADTIACFALMTLIGTEDQLATTDFNIRFLAPCLTDVRAVARTIKAGRTLCPVQVDLYDLNNRHVAVAQVNYIRISP